MPTDWQCANATQGEVQAKIDLASDGDRVLIPTDTQTWSVTVTCAKAIVIQGNGIGNTIIRDGLLGGNAGRLLDITLVANKNTRLTGIEFNDNGRTSDNGIGIIAFTGGGGSGAVDQRRFRIDHCKFDHLKGVSVRIARAYGVADNNTFLQLGNKTSVFNFNGTDYAYADARWAEAPQFGTDQFVFIETNKFIYDAGTAFADIHDSQGGTRTVVRHNNITNAFVEAHGTESVGRPRGTVAMEVYDNTFTMTTGLGNDVGQGCNHAQGDGCSISTLVGLRSGTALVYNNTGTYFTASGLNSVNLTAQRYSNNFQPFGIADGRNPWDSNGAAQQGGIRPVSSATGLTVTDNTANFGNLVGLLIRRLTPPPFNVPITGVTTGSPGLFSTFPVAHGLLDSVGPNTPPVPDTIFIEQLLGNVPHVMGQYTVNSVVDATTITLKNSFGAVVNVTTAGTGGVLTLIKRGNPAVQEPNASSFILSNTSQTITFENSFNSQNNLTFNAGDTFELNQVNRILDQPGVNGGTNLNGVITPTWPTTYDQTDTPVYEWNNKINGNTVTTAVGAKYVNNIILNTHYFTDHRQPPGYIPFVYPHPLASGGAPPPPTDVSPVVIGKRFRHFH